MQRSHMLVAAAVIVASAVFSSCAPQTVLTSTWEVPTDDVGPFDKVVVIAVMHNEDEGRAFELAAANQLQKKGIQAVRGYSILKGAVNVDMDDMEARVNKTGADAVLIFKVIALDKYHHYVPPTAYVVPAGPYPEWWDDPYWGYYTPFPDDYWGYWYPAVQVTRTPGYWTTESTFRVETTLYRTSDNRLVWTGVSKTYDPDTQYELGQSLAKRVVQRLERDGMLALAPARDGQPGALAAGGHGRRSDPGSGE